MINIIFEGTRNGDYNRARKVHSYWQESYVVRARHRVEEDPINNFGLADLEGITTPHEDVLVI